MSDNVVSCSRGHELSRVVRDGIQRRGGREKQRWRCTLPDGSHHRFLGSMSRTRTEDGICLECENHVHPHQGPQAPAEFEYLVREIAGALVDLDRGSTYTDAAKRVRALANLGKTAKFRDVINGQTVAEWMSDFVPVVSARFAPTEWPPVLVIDSSSFRWTDPVSGDNLQLYTLFAAYGYDRDGKNGRLWKMEVGPAGDSRAWAEFLDSLPGKPESIVCDQDRAILGGIEIQWGQWAATNLVHHCEHHLAERAKAAFNSDKLQPRDLIRELFRGALQSREQWDAFEAEVHSRPELMMTTGWLNKNAVLLRGQITGRDRIPPVYSNSAVEQPLREFTKTLRPRTFAFRNRIRLNNLLALMRLAYLRVDSVAGYSIDIRTYIDAHNGHPQRTYRESYDPKFDSAGTSRLNSLWSAQAQEAMAGARMRKALVKPKLPGG